MKTRLVFVPPTNRYCLPAHCTYAALFRWLWIWQLYGGGEAEPFAGAYVVGLEPWTGPPQLSRAIASGDALTLEPGASRDTTLRLRV